MEEYTVTGMSCAACSARVEKAVSKIEGVKSCSVSLLTNSMGVEGTAAPSEIINAVEKAGYGASIKSSARASGASGLRDARDARDLLGVSDEKSAMSTPETLDDVNEMLEDKETPRLKKRLYASVVFLIVLMYFSMGHMMWGWPIPSFYNDNHVAMGITQLLLSGIIMVINQKFFISGFKSLANRAPNMDTLVALGATAAFVYSTFALFAMTDAQLKGNAEAVMGYMHEFYFESAAMILTLITVGKMLEAKSKGKTTDALRGLMKLAPKTATLIVDGAEQTVPIEQVKIDDLFVVRPGETIPVDGMVEEGSSAINEAALTGESIPVDKAKGDEVSAATLNQSGFLKCRATRVGEDTTLSQIIQMVSDAATTKAPIAKIADKVSGVFVPTVIGIALVTIVVWLLVGEAFGFALARGISVLVISCPCALGLATPVAIMVGNGMGAKHGIMFKTAVSLEEAGKVKVIAFDKTGTITRGEPRVTDVLPTEGVKSEELLKYAYALEQKSEHPLAKAVLEYCKALNIEMLNVSEFEALPGNGLAAICEGEKLIGGSYAFISDETKVEEALELQIKNLSQEGKTPLLFTKNGALLGVIAVADVIKEESPKAIVELNKLGIDTVMITGDNETTANAIGKQVGVTEVYAGVLPNEKEKIVQKLKEKGKVAMVGDGINDAPALTSADIGIAIGAGVDIAIDAADVVLMKSRLTDVVDAIRLSRATLKNIYENLFWAFFYNVIGIPLAAGLFIPIFHWELNPMFGAAAMSLSSFCVVTNALRINLFKTNNYERRKKQMTKTMKIEGMMCGHCEARVKKCLEEIPQVDEAIVSHEAGTAKLTLNGDVEDDVLKKKVEEQDYKVITIE